MATNGEKEKVEDVPPVVSSNVRFNQVRIWSKADKPPSFAVKINVTSRSEEDWSRKFSPFFLGPVEVWPTPNESYQAKLFENAWQYLKVYKYTNPTNNEPHIGEDGEPTAEWLSWAKAGWENPNPRRCPMGRGAKPQYAVWKGEHKLYVASRFSTYAPIYAALVEKHCLDELQRLRSMLEEGKTIALFDFDGYDHVLNRHDFDTVIYNNLMRMGHGMVLAMILLGQRVWEKPYDPTKEHNTAVKRNHRGAAEMGPLEYKEYLSGASEKVTIFTEKLDRKYQEALVEVLADLKPLSTYFAADKSPQNAVAKVLEGVTNVLKATDPESPEYKKAVETTKKYVGFKYGQWVSEDVKQPKEKKQAEESEVQN